MTTEQVRNSAKIAELQRRLSLPEQHLEKDVTRRHGWSNLQAGERLQACEKCQGLGPGGKIVRICVIEVKTIRFEPLRRLIDMPRYGQDECRREGFPKMTPAEFVAFFCKGHKGITPTSIVTRIEFGYV